MQDAWQDAQPEDSNQWACPSTQRGRCEACWNNDKHTITQNKGSTSEHHKPHNEEVSQEERRGAPGECSRCSRQSFLIYTAQVRTSDEEGRPVHKTSRKPSPERVQNKKRSLLAQNRETGKCAK